MTNRRCPRLRRCVVHAPPATRSRVNVFNLNVSAGRVPGGRRVCRGACQHPVHRLGVAGPGRQITASWTITYRCLVQAGNLVLVCVYLKLAGFKSLSVHCIGLFLLAGTEPKSFEKQSFFRKSVVHVDV